VNGTRKSPPVIGGPKMMGLQPKGNTEISYNWNESSTKKEAPA